MRIYEWTKKLGQQHWYELGENETLCGRPMLGNNYAEAYIEKKPCLDCAMRMEALVQTNTAGYRVDAVNLEETVTKMKEHCLNTPSCLGCPTTVTCSRIRGKPFHLSVQDIIKQLEGYWFE